MSHSYRTLLAWSLLVTALVFIAFGRSLTQDFAPVDDGFLIQNNLAVRGTTFDHLQTVFTTYDPELYIPLTFVSFQLNYLVSGLAPWSYHLANLLLHSMNALLVGWLIFLLTRRWGIALACALLFAVHPIQTEAVVWAAGRKDLLATFFFLASCIAYLHSQKGGYALLMVSLVFFLCALLSKVTTATLPLVLILSDLLLERRSLHRRMVVEKIPYILLSGLFAIIALGGKERVLESSTISETFLMAMKSTIFYVQAFLLPLNLSIFHPFDGIVTWSSPEFFVPLVLVSMVVGLGLMAIKRAPWLSFGIFFFLITLCPTFLNFHKGDQMFFAVDRYAYIPSIGFFLIAALAGAWLVERWMGHASAFVKHIVVGVAIMICVMMSMVQTRTWDSAESLFTHALALSPESAFVRANLSSIYRLRDDTQKAFAILKEGLRYGDSAKLTTEAGLIYSATGQVEEARVQFSDALRMDPTNPEPLYYLGFLDEHDGKKQNAMEHYAQAIEIDPTYVVARTAFGNLLLEKGDGARAEEQFRTSITLNPNAVDAHIGLAVILSLKGDEEAATRELMIATQLDSSSEQRFNTLKEEIQ